MVLGPTTNPMQTDVLEHAKINAILHTSKYPRETSCPVPTRKQRFMARSKALCAAILWFVQVLYPILCLSFGLGFQVRDISLYPANDVYTHARSFREDVTLKNDYTHVRVASKLAGNNGNTERLIRPLSLSKWIPSIGMFR